MTDRVHSTGAVAVSLRVRPCTVQAYARDGRIPFDVTPGGHRRFDLDEVRAALENPPVRRTGMSEQIGEYLKWKDDVADHDYAAAENYLSLLLPVSEVTSRVKELRRSSCTTRRANDILRATELPPLPLTDPGVLRDLKKVLAGERLSPILMSGGLIADGYHRVSLAYALDPFADVPLKIES
jgi:DNA-binding transcriptional MerR regulator